MVDYYTNLARKIHETADDPAKIREVVYEAARLALRGPLQGQGPCANADRSKNQFGELEDAISRLEALGAGVGGSDQGGEAAAKFKTTRPRLYEPSSAELIGLHAVAGSLGGMGHYDQDGALENPHDPLPALLSRLAVIARNLGRHGNSERAQPVAGTLRQSHSLPIASSEGGHGRPPDPSLREPWDARINAQGRCDRLDVGAIAAALEEVRRSRKAWGSGQDEACDPSPSPAGRAGPGAGRTGHGEQVRNSGGPYSNWQNRYGAKSEQIDAPDTIEEFRSQPLGEPNSPDQVELTRSRELVLIPRRPARLVKPGIVHSDMPNWVALAPPARTRLVVSGLMIAFQLTIAAIAVAAFYVAMWGRDSVRMATEKPPAAWQSSITRSVAEPNGTTKGLMMATASLADTPIVAALPFPRPTSYGVYAVRDDQLVELEQVQATPVDPRTRNQLQLVKPGRVILADTKPAFLVFRRDLVSSAPEKVPVRIASRIAHSMIFDSAGKPAVTTPATDTWLIRDKGFDLRVAPLRESPEMVILRPESPEFALPSGRYELMFGGQAYDFVIAGKVTDPAHCVEGVATGGGPVFYECKPPR